MSTPKAIIDARGRVRDAEAIVNAAAAKIAEIDAQRQPIHKALEAHRVRNGKAFPLFTKSPAGIRVDDIGAFGPGTYNGSGIQPGETERAYAKRLIEGNAKLTMHGGQDFSPKSLGARARVPLDRASLKRIAVAQRKADKAARAAATAKAELGVILAEEFERSPKAPVDTVARYVAKKAVLMRQLYDVPRTWMLEGDKRNAEFRLEQARIHLAWAEARTKDDCLCSRCKNERQAAAYAAEQAAREKALAKEQAAATRRATRQTVSP